jgi:hypothetical protein
VKVVGDKMRPFYTLGPPVTLPAFGGGIYVRIGEQAQKCVVFFGVPSHKTTGAIEYGGTGFLVGVKQDDGVFTYLVTARHNADELDKWADTGFTIRANLKGGGSVSIPVEKAQWARHPDDQVDLAATPFRLATNFDVAYFSLESIVPQTEVIPGDVVSVVGLFRLLAGSNKNVAVVHTGNVAAMPDPSERLPIRNTATGKRIDVQGYLIQVPSLSGLSGAPIFLHESISLTGLVTPEGLTAKGFAGVKIVGVYVGAWDARPGEVLSADKDLSGEVRVPVSIGVAVPGERIIELIKEHPVLKKKREDLLRKIRDAKSAKMDSGFSAPPATDENPKHREDFNSLVDVAGRKQKQDDQT